MSRPRREPTMYKIWFIKIGKILNGRKNRLFNK